jgi:WhiB family redox-sensing transcriptional regulator
MLVRPRWIAEGPRPAAGGVLLRLAAGVYIVRSRQWLPASSLDRNAALPAPEQPEYVRRRFPHPRWHLAAQCSGVDDALFFGDEIEVATPRRRPVLERARTWCRPCVVRVVCLAHALLKPEDYGVWGGVAAAERDLLKAAIALTGTPATVIAEAAGVSIDEAAAAVSVALAA